MCLGDGRIFQTKCSNNTDIEIIMHIHDGIEMRHGNLSLSLYLTDLQIWAPVVLGNKELEVLHGMLTLLSQGIIKLRPNSSALAFRIGASDGAVYFPWHNFSLFCP